MSKIKVSIQNELSERIKTAQIVHLTSFSGMGKSTLLNTIADDLKDSYYLINIDFKYVENLRDMERILLTALINNEAKYFSPKDVLNNFKEYNPIMRVRNGREEYIIDAKSVVSPFDLAKTVKLFKRVENGKFPIIVLNSIDEIVNIEDSKEILKTFLPQLFKITLCPIILTTSIENDLGILKEYLESIETFKLEPIPYNDYLAFMKENVIIDDKTLRLILTFVGENTYFRNLSLEALKALPQANLIDFINHMIHQYEHHYSAFYKDLTPLQRRILKLMCLEDEPKVYSKEFQEKIGFVANNAVDKVLKSLLKRRLIIRDNKSYKVKDPFFREWVKFNFPPYPYKK